VPHPLRHLRILLGFCTAADIASADKAEAWTALHAGRHVTLMRDTDAPGGAGDPPGFRVDDCACVNRTPYSSCAVMESPKLAK
jgi:hypothetical protein